ncbi:response regulator [Pleurocapsa sp. PCC 7319]|uniref:hybrid sensor histidine kinase/response regulator n=1 Tax=Pleurocapsa sp. PCC 7319 TaxID=118161 RepID=UPI000344BFF7|nr:response regulator [Pleurocapsa sp. PCC 7319]
MSEDKELQVRLQFLEEAREYIDDMESGLLGLGSGQVNPQQIDSVLRAAHSIKGGAAMMRFPHLSHLAHRLEDFFKVLKVGKTDAVDSQLETWLLSGADFLRQVIAFNRQQIPVDQQWLEETVNPLFDRLHERLGDPQPEDAAALLSAEVGEDMSTLIFETEVEETLSQLESIVGDADVNSLNQELLNAAQELSGLGEMLELPAFAELCQSTIDHLEATPDKSRLIATAALQAWRRSQALILVGQAEVIPHTLQLEAEEHDADVRETSPQLELLAEEAEEDLDFSELDRIIETENIEDETLDLFTSLDDLVATPKNLINAVASTPIASQEQPEVEQNVIPPAQLDAVAVVSEERTQTIRVDVKQLEQLSDLFGEIAIERNGLNLRINSLNNLVDLLRQRIKTLEQSNFKLRIAYDKVATDNINLQSNSAQAGNKAINATVVNQGNVITAQPTLAKISLLHQPRQYFDSLEMDSYSDIHLLSQEVMETVVQLQEVAQDIKLSLEDTDKNAKQLDRASKQMQNTITRVRMRPISDVLNRFPRALRDLEIKHGKKVQLKIRGGSTLVERSVLEVLNDPLLHLFRNAFDHGIESPEVRLAANKPAQGSINISAVHRGNQTIITISDDGGGIDINKVKAKAIAMGIDEADLANASKLEILDLIFEPGFSTAEQVTDLSGRGVGMDVVRTNIEQIKGTIQVNTQLGIGTSFIIKVPFSLSVERVLLVESNGILMAFPTSLIEEMLILDSQMVSHNEQGQEILISEEIEIRLIRLNQWLHLSSFAYNSGTELETEPTIEEPTVLIIAVDDERLVGIQIDRYWQEEEVTVRSVEGNIAFPPGFSGCIVLGDGRVVPLVDAIGLINWIETEPDISTSRLSAVDLEASKVTRTPLALPRPTIMIIDDSINVRRFLALTLEKADYQVEQAKDGQDALDKIKAGVSPRAIVCDIEMPRLDGFGFLGRLKAEPQYKNLPVIMLTSRSGEKHRQLAMNLGATDYFSKPFKEKTLISTLKKITK